MKVMALCWLTLLTVGGTSEYVLYRNVYTLEHYFKLNGSKDPRGSTYVANMQRIRT